MAIYFTIKEMTGIANSEITAHRQHSNKRDNRKPEKGNVYT